MDSPAQDRVRFPTSRVSHVASRIGAVLDVCCPSVVISAAAAGADLVMLDEAQVRRVPVHILVPLSTELFVERSVADCGGDWVERFHRVLDHATGDPASMVEHLELDPHSDWYLKANELLVQRAVELAGPRSAIALTVRPVEGEEPPSATDDFATRAIDAGLLVLSIDPRPDHDAVVV